MKKKWIIIVFALFAFSCNNSGSDKTLELVENTLEKVQQHTLLMAESLSDAPGRLPKTIGIDGELETSNDRWWTSGFFPGQLWYMYEYSGNETFKDWAELYSERVSNQQFTTETHDLGFIIFCSYGNGYRITGNEEFLPIIKNASESLITRFNPEIGAIRSWDRASWNEPWQYAVIIDNMMNLELLEWSSRMFNRPDFAEVARTHANTSMQYLYRPDGSSYHVVSFDTVSSSPEYFHTHQGYSHESAWARGQAWGLYGFVMMYRETGMPEFLEHAVKIADFIVNHPRLPEDKIPYWDYDAPGIPNTLRDVSAGSITCSALLELHRYVDEIKAEQYLDVARKQLHSLCSEPYLAEVGTNRNFILKHSVGHMPNGSEIDVPLSYADYYFVEALIRYKVQFGIQ